MQYTCSDVTPIQRIFYYCNLIELKFIELRM